MSPKKPVIGLGDLSVGQREYEAYFVIDEAMIQTVVLVPENLVFGYYTRLL